MRSDIAALRQRPPATSWREGIWRSGVMAINQAAALHAARKQAHRAKYLHGSIAAASGRGARRHQWRFIAGGSKSAAQPSGGEANGM